MINKYIFKRPDSNSTCGFVVEEVMLERWAWGVIYNDGTEMKQFGDDGVFHQFQEIRQEDVDVFVMYKLDDPQKRIDMDVRGKQIFHFYRNFVFGAGTPNETRAKVYCFGWTEKTGWGRYEEKKEVCCYIMPDDRIVFGNRETQLTNFNI